MLKLIRQHPVTSYFLLAIIISWSGILIVAQPETLPAPADEAQRLFPAVYLAMLLGPSAAGLLVTWAAGGGTALREYRSRLTHWRVGARWYAIALLTAPLLVLVTTTALSFTSSNFLPAIVVGGADPAGPVHATSLAAFLVTGLAVGIGAGFFEELGWTGLAVPQLLGRHGIAATGLAVGVVWGLWHYLAIHWGIGSALGNVHPLLYLVIALLAFLPPYRVLMVWVYRNTHSLPIGILMHIALTSSMLLLGPAVTGRDLLVFDLAFGAVLWSAALLVLMLEKRRERVVGVRVEVRLRAV